MNFVELILGYVGPWWACIGCEWCTKGMQEAGVERTGREAVDFGWLETLGAWNAN